MCKRHVQIYSANPTIVVPKSISRACHGLELHIQEESCNGETYKVDPSYCVTGYLLNAAERLRGGSDDGPGDGDNGPGGGGD
jgi:hypothetical protein